MQHTHRAILHNVHDPLFLRSRLNNNSPLKESDGGGGFGSCGQNVSKNEESGRKMRGWVFVQNNALFPVFPTWLPT
jgi:hypothetical protein